MARKLNKKTKVFSIAENLKEDIVLNNKEFTKAFNLVHARIEASHKYELCILLRPELGVSQNLDILNKVYKIIKEYNGRYHDSEYWGLRKLAYRIKKMQNAHYYCLQYSGNLKLNTEIERFLSLRSEVVRFLIKAIDDFNSGPSIMMENMLNDLKAAAYKKEKDNLAKTKSRDKPNLPIYEEKYHFTPIDNN